MPVNMIETRNLTKQYGPKTAVNSLSLSIGKGELFSLLGVMFALFIAGLACVVVAGM